MLPEDQKWVLEELAERCARAMAETPGTRKALMVGAMVDPEGVIKAIALAIMQALDIYNVISFDNIDLENAWNVIVANDKVGDLLAELIRMPPQPNDVEEPPGG